MAIKDYKSQAPAAQPPTKKSASKARRDASAFKKVTIGFVAGFLLGLLVMGVFFVKHLMGDMEDDIEYVEQRSPNATDNQKQAEAPPPPSDTPQSSIDYQFYDELAKFELPEPNEGTAAQDEGSLPILPGKRGGAKQATKGEGQGKLPTRYILQAGTFTDAERAQIQRRKIIDLGYKNVHIFQAAYDDKQYYRVWLGLYSDQEKARAVGNALKAARIEVMLRYDLRSFNPRQE